MPPLILWPTICFGKRTEVRSCIGTALYVIPKLMDVGLMLASVNPVMDPETMTRPFPFCSKWTTPGTRPSPFNTHTALVVMTRRGALPSGIRGLGHRETPQETLTKKVYYSLEIGMRRVCFSILCTCPNVQNMFLN